MTKPDRTLIPKLLVEMLDFYKFKILKGDCTDKDMQSAFEMLTEGAVSQATTAQIAEYFGQSPSNVRNIISRWGIKGESKRLFDFNKLLKFIPKSWKRKSDEDTD